MKKKNFIHKCNQINKELCGLISEKKKHKQCLKIKSGKKSKNKYRSRYSKTCGQKLVCKF